MSFVLDERSHWQRYYERQSFQVIAALLRHFKATHATLTVREMMTPAVIEATNLPLGDVHVRIVGELEIVP